jgi:succinate dehydrogenase/fumarate reductase flavoprotein subunit
MQPAPEEHALETLSVDLLVIGAGVAGLSAAAHAVQLGLTVGVIEKAPEPGGSAALSGGFCWSPADLDTAWREDPDGDPELVRVLVEGFADAIDWVRSLGVYVSEQVPARVNTFPSFGYSIDILGFIRRARVLVEEAGGWVVTSADTESLIIEDGEVRGAVVADRDGRVEVRAGFTLLASGGFQNNSALRAKFLGAAAGHVVLRSNPNSTGRGLELALSAGATLSPHMNSFYGHLIPTPLANPFEPRDYVRLAQLYSPRCLMLDKSGGRFADESRSYHHNARAVARHPDGVALLVGDEEVTDSDRSGYGGVSEQIDRIEEARLAGGHTARADTLAGLARQAAQWGYRDVDHAVERFNASIAVGGADLDPPRRYADRAFDKPPFFAVEVQSALTYTMGGPLIGPDTQVLRPDGEPIPGLLAAGADAGGLYHDAYLGGLSMGLTFGRRAAGRAAHR